MYNEYNTIQYNTITIHIERVICFGKDIFSRPCITPVQGVPSLSPYVSWDWLRPRSSKEKWYWEYGWMNEWKNGPLSQYACALYKNYWPLCQCRNSASGGLYVGKDIIHLTFLKIVLNYCHKSSSQLYLLVRKACWHRISNLALAKPCFISAVRFVHANSKKSSQIWT